MARSRTSIILPAVVAGIGISALAQVLALVAQEQGLALITRILDWPNTLIQSLMPCPSVGISGNQRCEGSPQNLWIYLASFPIGAAVYSVAAYLYFRKKRRAA